MPMILTIVIAALIAFYVGWVIYKSIKRVKDGKACHGCGCDNCAGKCEHKK